jgi:hypothetical protein
MPLHPTLAATAAAQGGPFCTAQALAAGYEEREVTRLVQSKEWTRLRRGVLIDSKHIPDDESSRALVVMRALGLRVQGPIVASHHTAATIHQLTALKKRPEVLNPGHTLEVLRPGLGSGRIEAGVRWRVAALPASQLIQVDGVCCTTVPRTIIDIARETDFAEGLVVAESALNRRLTTLSDLREIHELCSDWSGARNAGRVVSFASELSESPGESLSRIAFADCGLPDPAQQRYIHDAVGLIGRVDFLWEQFFTIGEFDGKVKYVKPDDDNDDVDKSALYDEKRREDRLRDAGFEVVRFGWADIVGRPEWVSARVRAAFARAARRRGLKVVAS